ncbi:MAG: hypothetical protein WCP89_04035, partial [archaeon]
QFPYLGRSYAWAKRENATDVSEMSSSERDELFDRVLPEWERAVKGMFKHDLTNVACLCNTARHLHWHFIPRYISLRTRGGIEFMDQNPDGNYAPYPKRDLPLELIFEIRDEMAERLKR